MLGLLYLLRTTDIHYENIIAFSANPVLIDLEALFHNRFHILEQNTAPGKITGIIEGSVRNVGILPNLTWHSKDVYKRQPIYISVIVVEGMGKRNPHQVASGQ